MADVGAGAIQAAQGCQPRVGTIGELACVPEYKVEVLCSRHTAAAVEAALLEAHPYEEPAYDFSPSGAARSGASDAETIRLW